MSTDKQKEAAPALAVAAGSPPFPIQGFWLRAAHKWVPAFSIPWALIAPHETQALANHCGQSLDRLASRHGLSPCEAVAIIEDRAWHAMDEQAALDRLAELVREHQANVKISHAEDKR